MTATAMLTPDSRWPSGVALPVQALVAPETNGKTVSRLDGSKPVLGGATGLGAGGLGAGLAGSCGSDGITCTAASGDTYRTFSFCGSCGRAEWGRVSMKAGSD